MAPWPPPNPRPSPAARDGPSSSRSPPPPSLQVDFATATWARVYLSLGIGFLFLPLNTAACNGLPPEKNNSAAGLINLFRNIGGSVGISFAMTLLTRRMQHHQRNIAFHTNVLHEPFRQAKEQATGLLAGLFSSVEQATQAAHELLHGLHRREAAMRAYVDVFFALDVLFLAMLPLILLLRRTTPGRTPPGVH